MFETVICIVTKATFRQYGKDKVGQGMQEPLADKRDSKWDLETVWCTSSPQIMMAIETAISFAK